MILEEGAGRRFLFFVGMYVKEPENRKKTSSSLSQESNMNLLTRTF